MAAQIEPSNGNYRKFKYGEENVGLIKSTFAERWSFIENYALFESKGVIHQAILALPDDDEVNGDTFDELCKMTEVYLPNDDTCDMSEQDEDGNTPLHYAILWGYNTGNYIKTFAVIKFLLAKGADIYRRNNQGLTVYELLNKLVTDINYEHDHENNPYMKCAEHNAYRFHEGTLYSIWKAFFRKYTRFSSYREEEELANQEEELAYEEKLFEN